MTQQKLKIVQVITELRPAGAERILVELSSFLKNSGHEVTVVSLKSLPEKSPIVDELRAGGIPIETLSLTKFTPWRIFSLGRILEKIKPDILHAHLIHANIASRICRKYGRCRVVNTVHIAERRKARFWYFLVDRLTFARCDVMNTVSESVKYFHAARMGIKSERLEVVYNGLKFNQSPSPEEIAKWRGEWAVSSCEKVIGSIGRLDWQKGYDMLLSILPEISEKIPSGQTWALVILGQGPERGKLEKLIESAPGNIKVVLPGFAPDAAKRIGAFDLFVMPSRYEGFGLALIEAMAQGVPLVYNNIDSLPEIAACYPLAGGVDFEHSPGALLAEKICTMLDKEKISFQPPFSVAKMGADYLGLYGKLLK